MKVLLTCMRTPLPPPGLWRGSVVAIKVMILPARMSGKEKRERMALMEAAISSVMTHPNIVQVCVCVLARAYAFMHQTARPACTECMH